MMTKRHRTEAGKSWPTYATKDAKASNKGKMEVGVPMQLWTNAEPKWYMVCLGTGSTNMWNVFKYNIALNHVVSGSDLLCLYPSISTGGARTRLTLVVLLVLFIFIAVFLSL